MQRIIDFLKVDAEGAEWPCLVDWLNSGILSRQVKQLAIEVHTPKFRVLGQTMTLDDHLRITWLFEELTRRGFRKYFVGSGNDCCSRFSDWALDEKFIHCCYELFYVNSKFLQ